MGSVYEALTKNHTRFGAWSFGDSYYSWSAFLSNSSTNETYIQKFSKISKVSERTIKKNEQKIY